MATTEKGIYYPADYDEVADIPDDMKKMAESIDDVIEHDRGLVDEFVEETNQKIETIQAEQTTQNENIQENTDSIQALETKHNTEVAELQSQIEELQEENQALADLIPTGEESGSDITLSDSARYYFKKIVPGGKSEHETFTGKNQLQVSATSQTINGIEYTINEDGTIKANGTATAQSQLNMGTFNFEANTSYILNGCPAGGSTSTYRQIISGGSAEYGEGVSVSYTEDTEASIYIRIMSGVTVNNLVFKPMIRLASIADATFEKYVGGQSAPNPNYECPIRNVTGNVEVKVENKNILNLNVEGILAVSIDTAIKKDNNIYIKTNTKYVASYRIPVKYKLNEPMTISFDAQFLKTLDIPNHNSLVYFRKGNMTKGAIGLRNNTNKNSYSITIEEGLDEEGYTFWIYLKTMQTDEAKEVEIQFENLQIEYGTKATTPVPHEEQTAIFPLEEGQVLHETDTIEDKIVQRGKTLVFDGTENWLITGYSVFYLTSITDYKISNGNICLCTHYTSTENVGASSSVQDKKSCFINTHRSYRFYIKDTSFETVEEFKTFLAQQYANGTPVTLEYELETPIEIPFTEAQRTAKAQIDKLYSYKGTTHITSNANLDVTYRKDPNIRDTRLDALEARVALLEG